MEHDPNIDPDRPHTDRPFDRAEGFTGQDYRADDERAIGRDMPSTQVAPPGAEPPADGTPDPELPPDNGARAAVDKNGEVRGSGVGTGGGQPGEDLDQDSATGDGPVITERTS